MQISSVNAHLTKDASERAQMWDAGSGPDLQIITAGTSLIVLARGQSAVDVFSAVHPLLRESAPPEPAVIEHEPPPRKTVPVTTGLRSAGVE